MCEDNIVNWAYSLGRIKMAETSSSDVLLSISDIIFRKRVAIDLNVVQQLPTHRYLYERYLTVLNEIPPNMHGRKDQALVDLKNEFECIWVHMNIPFMTRKGIKDKFLKLIGKIEKLKKTPHKHVKRQALFVLTMNHLENHWILASISALRTIGESQS